MKEQTEHIFTPFYTYGKQRAHAANVGLGLSIVFKIIADHDGLIHVESKPNEGTCFQVFLPKKTD